MISTEPRNTSFGVLIRSTELISTYIPSKSFLLLIFTQADPKSLTQATDTSNVRLVFAAVKETILQNALKDSGIL